MNYIRFNFEDLEVWDKAVDFANEVIREPLIIINLSLPRRRESSKYKRFWIPAFAVMTFLEVALRRSMS